MSSSSRGDQHEVGILPGYRLWNGCERDKIAGKHYIISSSVPLVRVSIVRVYIMNG